MQKDHTSTYREPCGKQRRGSYWPSLVSGVLLWAATVTSLPGVEPGVRKQMTVEVLQGQGAEHDLTASRESTITLRVTDQAKQPVVGAVVVLQLPQSGPGGNFSNGTRFQTMLSDANGQATVAGFHPNKVPGEFSIVTTVSYRDYESVTLNIEQKNVTPAARPGEPAPVQTTKRNSGKVIALVAIIGGAAAGAALGLSGGGGGTGSSQPPPSAGPPTSINPGNPNFGPPR